MNELFDDLRCPATECPLPEYPTRKQNRKGFFEFKPLEAGGGQESLRPSNGTTSVKKRGN